MRSAASQAHRHDNTRPARTNPLPYNARTHARTLAQACAAHLDGRVSFYPRLIAQAWAPKPIHPPTPHHRPTRAFACDHSAAAAMHPRTTTRDHDSIASTKRHVVHPARRHSAVPARTNLGATRAPVQHRLAPSYRRLALHKTACAPRATTCSPLYLPFRILFLGNEVERLWGEFVSLVGYIKW